jgi:hypothetical protein
MEMENLDGEETSENRFISGFLIYQPSSDAGFGE